jgi:hypothetical protein
MKGKLINKQGKWIVQYLEAQDAKYMCSQMTDVKELPLHPDSVANLEDLEERLELNQLPDNVEVEFEMEYLLQLGGGATHAKLIQPSKMTKESLGKEASAHYKDEPKEETWYDIFSEYKRNGTNWASKGDVTFLLWLKQNYFSPKKK